MNGIVRIALARPLTFIVMAILIAIVGVLQAARTPVDIFPNIGVPVIATAWQYTGLSPDDMSGRIITPFERVLTTTVNDIEHIESQSLNGIGVVKIYFQPGANIQTATAQVTSISQTILQAAAAGRHAAADPQLQRIDRADHPARAVGQRPVRADAVRPRAEPDPAAARHRAGRGDPLCVRRQAAAGPVRSRSAGAAIEGPVGPGRRQRDRRAEPDQPGRLRQDRHLPVQRRAQQHAGDGRGVQRPAGQVGQRRDDLHARRGARPRRLGAAAERRPCRRHPLRADDRAQERQDLDAGDHLGDQGQAAQISSRRCRPRSRSRRSATSRCSCAPRSTASSARA